jgi:hypothetical protein
MGSPAMFLDQGCLSVAVSYTALALGRSVAHYLMFLRSPISWEKLVNGKLLNIGIVLVVDATEESSRCVFLRTVERKTGIGLVLFKRLEHRAFLIVKHTPLGRKQNLN